MSPHGFISAVTQCRQPCSAELCIMRPYVGPILTQCHQDHCLHWTVHHQQLRIRTMMWCIWWFTLKNADGFRLGQWVNDMHSLICFLCLAFVPLGYQISSDNPVQTKACWQTPSLPANSRTENKLTISMGFQLHQCCLVWQVQSDIMIGQWCRIWQIIH